MNTTLGANVEQLAVYGGAIAGTGNSLNNSLYGASATAGVTFDGAAGDDTLQGSNFNDTLTGGSGADTFAFTSAFGNDIVLDFQATGLAHDLLQFDVGAFATATAALAAAAQVGADVVIAASASDSVTLKSINLASLSASDFRIG